ncbi:MAG: DUF222 domain-containing protein, partial [Micromonosporaceae bacterium]|nr:DUF222 domain-containing protein [Micromonosporaceae bacterium]
MSEALGPVADLEQLAPGAELAALLSTVDRSGLDPAQRVEVACARARLVAHLQAELLADLAAVAADAPDPQFAADELSFALHWTRFAAQSQVAFAQELTGRLPAAHAALLAGQIDLPRARVIAELTGPLEEETARLVVEKVLSAAPGLTTGQLRAKLRRLVISVDPVAAQKRQEQALRQRRLQCYPDPDGTATLLGTGLPAERTRAAANRIDQLARAAKQAGDARTMDQLRADTMLDLLDGTNAGQSVDARVEVTVPLQTLMQLADEPGELGGYGPLVADVARQ